MGIAACHAVARQKLDVDAAASCLNTEMLAHPRYLTCARLV